MEEDLDSIEVSETYKKDRQKDGMFDAYQKLPPEFPDCPYYMMGYNSVK